ncbi:SDR family NAD(P)-dependent oxidoreductase, partial [Rhizobium johnstonii]|uniref:SDR family NAD(P)-dependent oxidoreductase n=1 Tax=Rhizobium johnstonii TaxID=3019933 RepID=UPI003F9C4D28
MRSRTIKLRDKVCIFTGSASGIGLAISKKYVSEGAKVVIADLNLEAAEAAAKDLTAAGPGEASTAHST